MSSTTSGGYNLSMASGPMILYITVAVVGTLTFLCFTYCGWRFVRNRRRQRLGLPVDSMFYSTRPLDAPPPARPPFYDVWVWLRDPDPNDSDRRLAPADCSWDDLKPVALERVVSFNEHESMIPKKKRTSSLFFKHNHSGSTLDADASALEKDPSSLQVSVMIAMPCPPNEKQSRSVDSGGEMIFGVVEVPFKGELIL